MQKAFPQIGSIQKKTLPLNVKKVKEGSIERLYDLEVAHEEGKEFFRQQIRIANDVTVYTEAIRNSSEEEILALQTIKAPALTKKEIESLVGGKVERAKNLPSFGVFGFKVAEPHKSRCRCIFDCGVNAIFPKTPEYRLKTKHEVRKVCFRKGKNFVFIQFDFVSFYDQIVLAYEIRKYFGFRDHTFVDCFYWLRLLPMGFRLAVAAAQSIMWLFLNFHRNMEVGIATCIDNVAFSGEKEDVFPCVDKFLTRVITCGFTLAGVEPEYINWEDSKKESFLESLKEKNPTFLGEEYDLEANTRKVMEKTIDKLELVWNAVAKSLEGNLTSITNRQFFTLVGLLVYITQVLDLNTHRYFNIFKKIRALSSQLSSEEIGWDDKLTLSLSKLEFSILVGWVNLSIENKAVETLAGKKFQNVEDCKVFITVDASSWGWGAILHGKGGKYISKGQGAWGKTDMKASSKAEPLGVERALKFFSKEISHLEKGDIAVLTDHHNLVHAQRAVFTHSFYYNELFMFIEKFEKEVDRKVNLFFIEGERNGADGLSRGEKKVDDLVFRWPAAAEPGGTGLCKPLSNPPPWQL